MNINWQEIHGKNGHFVDRFGKVHVPASDLMTEEDYFALVDRFLDVGMTQEVLMALSNLWKNGQGKLTHTIANHYLGKHLNRICNR